MSTSLCSPVLFFFNDTATTEIYTLSLHDALPISSCVFVEAFARVTAHDAEPEREVGTSSHGLEDCGKTLVLPIIPNQKEHEIGIADVSAGAGGFTTFQSHVGGELRGVHTIGNYANVGSPKVSDQKRSGAFRNSREPDLAVGINAAFQLRQERLVKPAMQVTQQTRLHPHVLVLFPRELLKPMKKGVNYD